MLLKVNIERRTDNGNCLFLEILFALWWLHVEFHVNDKNVGFLASTWGECFLIFYFLFLILLSALGSSFDLSLTHAQVQLPHYNLPKETWAQGSLKRTGYADERSKELSTQNGVGTERSKSSMACVFHLFF